VTADFTPLAAEADGDADAGIGAGVGAGFEGWKRAARGIALLTALSRLTGLVRLLVVAAVLGTSFLGNTYQSANAVPNLFFELFAAGALQAVLVPTLVELYDRGDDAEAERVAGSIFGLLLLVLIPLVALALLGADTIMGLLVSGVAEDEVRDAQVRLGAFLLWFFIPQVLLYAAGAVASAVGSARHRFTASAVAPVLNNVVVTSSYALFWLLGDGSRPSLDVSGAQKLVLGAGTTLGVVALTAAPVSAALRAGVSLRPRLDHRHLVVRQLARRGAWASAYLALTQVLVVVVLVVANGVEGGVVSYQLAHTLFLLPHALVAVPVATALYPRLARKAHAGDTESFAARLGEGLTTTAFLTLGVAAAFVALADSIARLALFGSAAAAGTGQLQQAIVGFAPGLVGYGAFLLLARSSYALGDARLVTLVNLGVVALGATVMIVGSVVADGAAVVAWLAWGHSVAYLAGGGALLVLISRRLGVDSFVGPLRASLLASTASAIVAGVVMAGLAQLLAFGGRLGALVELMAGGALGLCVYVAAQLLLGNGGVLQGRFAR